MNLIQATGKREWLRLRGRGVYHWLAGGAVVLDICGAITACRWRADTQRRSPMAVAPVGMHLLSVRRNFRDMNLFVPWKRQKLIHSLQPKQKLDDVPKLKDHESEWSYRGRAIAPK